MGQSWYFYYQNPACHLISHVIFHNTGLTPYYFANIHLFPKLGITDPFGEYGWYYINDGGKGLWLDLRDMSKNWANCTCKMVILETIKYYLQPGFKWQLDLSSYTGLDPLHGYGYLFWVPDVDNTYFEDSFFIMGTGGQKYFCQSKAKSIDCDSFPSFPEDINDHANSLFLNVWDYIIPVFKIGDLNTDLKKLMFLMLYTFQIQ